MEGSPAPVAAAPPAAAAAAPPAVVAAPLPAPVAAAAKDQGMSIPVIGSSELK